MGQEMTSAIMEVRHILNPALFEQHSSHGSDNTAVHTVFVLLYIYFAFHILCGRCHFVDIPYATWILNWDEDIPTLSKHV